MWGTLKWTGEEAADAYFKNPDVRAELAEALAGMSDVYTDHPWDYMARSDAERSNYGYLVDRVTRKAASD